MNSRLKDVEGIRLNMSLDIGCSMRKQGDIGIDINRQSKADTIIDAHCIPFYDVCFDIVFVHAVLEHVENPERVLGEVNQVCKKDALVFVIGVSRFNT